MATPEGAVKSLIKAWVKSVGGYYAMPATGGYGVSGTPDFLICIGGTFLGIEAKAPGKLKNTTALQKSALHQIRMAGGYAYVVDSQETLDRVVAHLILMGVL